MPASSALPPLLAFGAHPDDIEFGAGGIIAREAQAARKIHFIVCSRGEAGTNGTPAQRTREAKAAAKILGASVDFLEFDGDAHLELKAAHALKLASAIRRFKPGIVLAPTPEPNQHPDHWRLGTLVRDAVRLARYGGLRELRSRAPHATGQLFFYALSPGSVPVTTPILIDVSAPGLVATWTRGMEAHESQMKTRNYVELQVARSRVLGLDAGVSHAQALYPNDPLLFDSLATLGRGARRF